MVITCIRKRKVKGFEMMCHKRRCQSEGGYELSVMKRMERNALKLLRYIKKNKFRWRQWLRDTGNPQRRWRDELRELHKKTSSDPPYALREGGAEK